MATKQDFQATAEILRNAYAESLRMVERGDLEAGALVGERITLARIAKDFADLYQRQNGRFDRGRFMSACGF